MELFPLYLVGNTLGKRHRYLNELVEKTLTERISLSDIQKHPEHSPVDLLFKIELSSKEKDFEYLKKILKHDDMFYVSRALKCKWLLGNEFFYIINPEYLERNLYPFMTIPAVNKMKRWVSINLKVPYRCQEFYEYYCETQFNHAIRFLSHCHISYILNEIPKIMDQINPFYLKILCERSPRAAKIFFDCLTTNERALETYIKNYKEFHGSIAIVLKANSDIFLDIIEKYYDPYNYSRLGPSATKFIIKNCKNRFNKKAELYAAWFFNIETLVKYLTSEERKELAIKLAKADFLDSSLSNMVKEDLLMRMNEQEILQYKKVLCNFGERISKWPYPPPLVPAHQKRTNLFSEISPAMRVCDDDDDDDDDDIHKYLTKAHLEPDDIYNKSFVKPEFLDNLMKKYQFCTFEHTITKLSRNIHVESSSTNRQYMILFLIARSGGRPDRLVTLLKLLKRYINEPPHFRAAIVRGLVHMAYIWRLPQESWESFLTFSVGLGLDGEPSEVYCREGLHAVIIRHLLHQWTLPVQVCKAYINDFSTLKEYSMTNPERKLLGKYLSNLLMEATGMARDMAHLIELFSYLFQILRDYKHPVNTDFVIPALKSLSNDSFENIESIILQLYQTKQARKELFFENFVYIATDASYLNALRHNTNVLKMNKYVMRVMENGLSKEQFFRKLAIYFSETNGLAELYLSVMKQNILNKMNLKLARPVAILIKSYELKLYLAELRNGINKDIRRFTVDLRSNSHLAKPKLNMDGLDEFGTKIIANNAYVCRENDVYRYLEMMLMHLFTVKLSIALAQRINAEEETFAAVCNMRPTTALRCALKYFHRNPNTFKQPVWEIIKPLILNFDFTSKSTYKLSKILWKVQKIPVSIRADYCVTLLEASKGIAGIIGCKRRLVKTFSNEVSEGILTSNINSRNNKTIFVLLHMYHLLELGEVKDEIIEDILSPFMETLSVEHILHCESEEELEMYLHLKILIKYLLVSKSVETQTNRLNRYADPLLNILKSVWQKSERNIIFSKLVTLILINLKSVPVFLNEEYVSCLPLLERIVLWMRSILPIEKYFVVYVNINLTKLYFKSFRQCIKKKPNIFKNELKKCDEGVVIFGEIFGRYLAEEVNDLKSKYPDTIVELHGKALKRYLMEHLVCDAKRDEIITAIIRGVLDYSKKKGAILAYNIYKTCFTNTTNTDVLNNIKSMLCNTGNKEVQFLINTEQNYTTGLI